MNRRSSFGRMLAWILLAVCFLPVVVRAEDQPPAAVGGTEAPAPLHRLTSLEATPGETGVRVVLGADGPISAHPFVLDSPDRLVLDLEGVRSALKTSRYMVDSPLVKSVRVGQRSGGAVPVARVVVDLKSAQPYSLSTEPNGLVLTVGADANGASTARTSPAEPNADRGATAPAVGSADRPGEAVPPAATAPSSQTPSAAPSTPDAVPAETTTTDHGSAQPVQIAEIRPVSLPGTESREALHPAPPSEATGRASLHPAPSSEEGGSSSSSAAAPAIPNSQTFETKTISTGGGGYSGKKISLNLVDADIKQIFRLFHEISGLNFVLDPGVSGNVTIVLDEVPWDQALDIILKNNGLDKVYENNVIRIATTQKLATEAGGRKALKEAKELEVDPVTITRRLSYAKAKDVDSVIKTGVLLSTRGKSFFDDRTNTLIITDVPTKIEPLQRLISTLDEKTPQVMIEARIVLTGRDFIQDLGIDWGFAVDRAAPAPNSGTNTSIPVTTGAGSPITSRDFPNSGSVGYGLNLPRAAGASQLAFNLFNASGSFRLNVALDALETDGRSRTLSAPKIATQNNVKAEIEQGVQIPIQLSTAIANTVTFVNATLKLSVTPQITAEGTVIMDITVENNQPSKTIASTTSVPAIDIQRAQTKVMVQDGGTTVIGGIFQLTESNSESGVPWFRKIPIFGWLFKSRNITTQNRELLIFITPKILKAV